MQFPSSHCRIRSRACTGTFAFQLSAARVRRDLRSCFPHSSLLFFCFSYAENTWAISLLLQGTNSSVWSRWLSGVWGSAAVSVGLTRGNISADRDQMCQISILIWVQFFLEMCFSYSNVPVLYALTWLISTCNSIVRMLGASFYNQSTVHRASKSCCSSIHHAETSCRSIYVCMCYLLRQNRLNPSQMSSPFPRSGLVSFLNPIILYFFK